VVFNPSFPYRLMHMVTAMYLTTSFVVAGISAWYLLRGRFEQHARIGFSMALGLITVLAPLQIFLGDLHGLNTLHHQPAKIAAMEGHWEGGPRAPLILFGWPDMQAETTRWEVGIPGLSSIILTHELEGKVPGLKQFPPEDRPNATILFWTFRIMVAIGLLMLAVGLTHLFLRLRGRLYEAQWFQWICVACFPIGFVAILSGWFTTEIGRQPWIVYGLVRTADGVTPALTFGAALTSLAAFVVVYALIYTAGTYYLFRLLTIGPKTPHEEVSGQAEQEARRPKRPMSLPEEGLEPAE
jgi:cytochrome bd ubiquinol oxidase subunit I